MTITLVLAVYLRRCQQLLQFQIQNRKSEIEIMKDQNPDKLQIVISQKPQQLWTNIWSCMCVMYMYIIYKCWLMVVAGLQTQHSLNYKSWGIDSKLQSSHLTPKKWYVNTSKPMPQCTTICATHTNHHTPNCWDNHKLVGWPTVSPQLVVKNFLRSVGVRVMPRLKNLHQLARHLQRLVGGPPIQKLSPPYVKCHHHHTHLGLIPTSSHQSKYTHIIQIQLIHIDSHEQPPK